MSFQIHPFDCSNYKLFVVFQDDRYCPCLSLTLDSFCYDNLPLALFVFFWSLAEPLSKNAKHIFTRDIALIDAIPSVVSKNYTPSSASSSPFSNQLLSFV